jgi:mono/diheme cytochrome c family protein
VQKASKQTVRIILAFLLVGLCGGCRFHFDTTPDQKFKAVRKTSSLENGKNLAFNICAGCHYDRATEKFSGKPLNDLPKIAGQLYSANLTQSQSHGIPPRYSDAELFYLLKTGISATGRFMPYMMRPMMADEDINDIIIYLRSSDPAVQAVDSTVGKTRINAIGKMGIRAASSPQTLRTDVASPPKEDAITYGRYLVGVIGCYHCHSEKVLGLNYSDPENSKGYLSGGMKLKDHNGNPIWGPNLTPDKNTGIGNFSKEDFRKAVREGIAPSGRELSPPMGRYHHLTDVQVDAIYSYLHHLKAREHKVRRLQRNKSIAIGVPQIWTTHSWVISTR